MSDISIFCKNLPKVELHAHLSGSVSSQTLQCLRKLQPDDTENNDPTQIPTVAPSHLSECFAVFKQIHKMLNSLKALSIATHSVIQEFAADNVIYLELRTTPRCFPSSANQSESTKRQYIDSIIDVIKSCTVLTPSGHCLTVRLLISVDRSGTVDEAMENVQCAIESDRKYVVGIDFSGNPSSAPFSAFYHVFSLARQHGFKISAHCAEICDEVDTSSILLFKPDRLGHFVCFSQNDLALVQNNRIPIEICPTSNLVTKAVDDISQHPFGRLFAMNHPITLCTDDCGVFKISLSSEYCQISNAFQLSIEQLMMLSENSINLIFAGEEVTLALKNIFKEFKASMSINSVST